MEYTLGKQIAKGKTKGIFAVEGRDDLVIVRNGSDITAHDDPSFTQKFGSKAQCATITTCRVFELLRTCDVPVAYVEQISETEFVALRSLMLLLEIVARRLGVGSFLMRNPQLRTADPTKPYRFHRLLVEFFLKTTGRDWKGLSLPCDDPLILDPFKDTWDLALPKKPIWHEEGEGESRHRVSPFAKIPASGVITDLADMAKLDQLVRRVSLILERAWANFGLTWLDIKIEADSELRVSDVVDNDSWRLWENGKPLDKQVFRDGGAAVLGQVEENYRYVAQMAERLVLPRQALVVWLGSDKDEAPKVPQLPGVTVERIVASGHKSPVEGLQRLERLFYDYPQGGVIVVKAGRSNGLGPIVAAHSPWPVISVPATLEQFPDDLWSSVHLPSQTPNLTTWPEGNAIGAAMQILGQTNPAVYAFDQMRREELDNYMG
ncbi:MAG: phosphoribosylaminoimidazolesuccinocarboxamide synthase [Patescibacteria group bacterium]|jgi:phosphoribosylaminoimidazole-succinocarboxamide synthase